MIGPGVIRDVLVRTVMPQMKSSAGIAAATVGCRVDAASMNSDEIAVNPCPPTGGPPVTVFRRSDVGFV
ncbi:hypothetical protein GS4_02_00720 [Gordonia soli NBRC 108243]|uniref:Uncharacterized protein n=1 Tax=Gordonia soli NBRC 108243 TaxID=1223545 RepID=M0QG61_9ACTN|nr:hypothetical protein GS4_02_00720 [Gordonia soli NBRC 108243]